MLESNSLAANLGIFAAAAAVVWIAGTRIARHADAIAGRTGIGREIIGMLLLGGVTSLPELAVAVTASLSGRPALSINDLLGSAAFNVVIIALADAVLGRSAITSVVASPGVLLQGVMGIVLLAMVVGATMTVDTPLLGASAWTWALLVTYAIAIRIIAKTQSGSAWKAVRAAGHAPAEPGPVTGGPALRTLVANVALAAAAVLFAGFWLAKSAEAIAVQTGLGANFIGVVLLAAATSLPEASTVVAAVRLKRYEMAISDVFGTNMFNVTILFAVDALYDGPPVLAEVGRFAGFGALVAIVLTAVYLGGMLERRDRTIARMGYDSVAAIGIYLAGLAILYQLR